MPMTITEKIIAAHAGRDAVRPLDHALRQAQGREHGRTARAALRFDRAHRPERVEGRFSKGGDGAVITRLVHIAAVKNPARKPGNGDKFYVTGIPRNSPAATYMWTQQNPETAQFISGFGVGCYEGASNDTVITGGTLQFEQGRMWGQAAGALGPAIPVMLGGQN